ncbi:MAG: ribbon-helix-helix domain-containing protein [Acidimicrobiales bacterium]
MSKKVRTTISLDRELAEAADEAVRRGEAASVSAFVSEAIAARVEDLVRLRYMQEALDLYEAEFGVITDEEMEATLRHDREHAIVVRGGKIFRP